MAPALFKRVLISNDLVITKDALLPYLPYLDFSNYDYGPGARESSSRLAALQSSVEAAGSRFLYVGVDEQRTALADYYPSCVYNKRDYYETMGSTFRDACADSGIHTFFLRDRLAGKDPLYYYSAVDHHYNLRGAYETYRGICEALAPSLTDFPVAEEAQLGMYLLPGDFYGSYSRRLYDISPVREQLIAFDTSILPAYERWDCGERTDAPVLKLPEEGENVSYTAYMGGDNAETVIQTNRPELPSILIVGDSFTNPVEALCVYSFNEIRSLDFRYYDEMCLTDYLALHPVDAVVVIRDSLCYVLFEGNGDLH